MLENTHNHSACQIAVSEVQKYRWVKWEKQY